MQSCSGRTNCVNCGLFARKLSLGLKSIRLMTYNTLQHGEPTSPRDFILVNLGFHMCSLSMLIPFSQA